jgi:hypothetical protein
MSRIKKPSAMNASSKWREPPMSKQTPVRAFAVGTALGLLAGLGAVFLDRKMGASKDNATSPELPLQAPSNFQRLLGDTSLFGRGNLSTMSRSRR